MSRAILTSIALAACLSSVGYAQRSVGDIVRQSQAARKEYMDTMAQGIVRVEAYRKELKTDDKEHPPADETGTGIVLSASSGKILILTASHVVEDMPFVYVTFYSNDRERYRANIPQLQWPANTRDKRPDIALLEVSRKEYPKLPTCFPNYQFLRSRELQLGEQVYTVNGDWVPVPNTVTYVPEGNDDPTFQYTDVSVGLGFSGGPVFDQYGNVLGMHVARTGYVRYRGRDGKVHARPVADAHYAVATNIEFVLRSLQKLHYPDLMSKAIPKAVEFSIPQLNASGPGCAASAASDLELFQKAMASGDPNAMEGAAAKVSNPTFRATLSRQAQVLQEQELFQQAMASGDPAAMKEAIDKVSNPAFKAALRKQEQVAQSAASDQELYREAMSLRDPAAVEADADKISNQTLANILRMQAKNLRAIRASTERFDTTNTRIEADADMHRGNYQQAFPLYRQLAEGGDSRSMVNLGYLYYNGLGVPKDYAQAAIWFQKAADAGETSVMAHLGMMYAFGEGVKRNDELAVELDRKAAAAGDSLGMLGLGYMYENGRGVPKDMSMAIEWYRKSANLGNKSAEENLRRLGQTQ